MYECCQGVCEVYKLAVLGRRPGFDPFVFELFSRAGLLFWKIEDCSNSGFTNDLNSDFEGSNFDRNHWRT